MRVEFRAEAGLQGKAGNTPMAHTFVAYPSSVPDTFTLWMQRVVASMGMRITREQAIELREALDAFIDDA